MSANRTNDAAWKAHLDLQTELYCMGMQVLADKVLSNPDPMGPFQRFNRLWQKYAESAERLKGLPHPSDAAIMEKLQKGAQSLVQIMGSMREEAAAQMQATRNALSKLRSSGSWSRPEPRAGSRMIRTQA